MCTYISVALPKSADFAECKRQFIAHKLGLNSEDEGHPKGVLNTEDYFFTCTKYCDCGTRLGAACRPRTRRAINDPENLAGDLRRKGWSETKIKRRLNDLAHAAAKGKRVEEAKAQDSLDEIENWLDVINVIITSKAAAYIGVAVNDYTGPVNNPPFASLTRRNLPLAKLQVSDLESIAPAELLVIS